MVFSSVVFLFLFLPIVLLAYFAVKGKARNLVLVIASLFFYAWGEPVYLFLMIFSILFSYGMGRLIDRKKKENDPGAAKLWLICSIFVHIGLLVVFKYTDFLLENANHLFHTHLPLANIALPIGISFYTFQILSYVIDVYAGKVAVQKNVIHLAAYVSLFPQLIAGPIVRYETVEKELVHRVESIDEFALGARRFIVGLGKKVLIANTIGQLYDTVHALPDDQQSVLLLWLAAVSYTFQIYYDFSGYSDMAIGLGRMFGFHFLENFNYPYMSASITEFWRRWHISLSSWFRDYVYIPLGGNRVGKWKQYRNIIIVWLLTGIWHGAQWTFVGWGLYFCVWLILEKVYLLKLLQKLPKFVGRIYAMVLVVISWTMFAASDMGDFFHSIKGMFGCASLAFVNENTLYYLTSYAILFVVAAVGATNVPKNLADFFFATGKRERSVFFGGVHIVLLFGLFFLCVAYLVSASFNPFLYFRF